MASGFKADVASVGRMWVAASYEDLRRAGPDRARQVRRMLDSYVVPWFGPQTETVADITYPMVHEWLLMLVDRRPAEPEGEEPPAPLARGLRRKGVVSLREAAQAGGVSVATARRRWRDGELVGAYRDPCGHIRVPESSLGLLRKAETELRRGLSQSVVTEALWVLRRVLGFARANGIVAPGFDPTEGLEAPRPDLAAARTKRPTSQPRPLSLPECARIAARLHPVHQLVFWLQRIMGLRLSEAFGVLVDDVVDLGGTGLLLIRGQGGRLFRVRDDYGRVMTVSHKEATKTAASTRVLVVPPSMMELLRVVLDAFHTDPETGDVEETARLVPGLRRGDEAGQLSYREAFVTATAAEGLGSAQLGFRVSPHLLRKSIATDLAWQPGIEDAARRRFMGHRAADDVYGRIYTLDHPELAPLEKVAAVLDELIRGSIGSLLIPTTRRIHWAHGNRYIDRAAQAEATLGAAGWLAELGGSDDPYCDTGRVAAEMGVAPTTARRWMREGALPCVIASGGDGIERRWVRLSEISALRQRLADRVLLPDLAEELGARYHELYRLARSVGVELDRHPTSRHFELSVEAADALRAEHGRVRSLHRRSMKAATAAGRLGVAVSTIGLMLKREELEVDPETDSSGARFITRRSVERCLIKQARLEAEGRRDAPSVEVSDVVRFTGHSRVELLDLVRAGVLEVAPDRGKCRLSSASLTAWIAATA